MPETLVELIDKQKSRGPAAGVRLQRSVQVLFGFGR